MLTAAYASVRRSLTLAALALAIPTLVSAQSTARIDPSIASALAMPRPDWLRGPGDGRLRAG